MKKIKFRRIGALLLSVSIAFAAFSVPVSAQSGVQLNGIDVSNHNGSIDWNSVKNAGTEFAMIRDGYGGDPGYWDVQTDARFDENYNGAVAAGIKVGAYHYSYATDATMASQEADECLYILKGRHLDYPVAYDVEDPSQYGLSSDTLEAMVQAFCSKIEQAGYKTMVYSFKNFFIDHLTTPAVRQHDLWVSHTGGASSPGVEPCAMWQYAQQNVPGVNDLCDMDFSYVDYASGGKQQPPVDPLLFVSDTSSYTFKDNKTYTYKITTPDTYPPTAKSSNPSAVSVSGPRATSGGYLFTLTNVGSGSAEITTTAGDGRSVSFTATGSSVGSTLKCDTSSYKFGTNSAYYYKVMPLLATPPTASSSDSSIVSVEYDKQVSDGYLYKITNVGAGIATITTKASDGSSVSFPAMGAGSGPASSKLWCDTSSYTFGTNSTYYYKIKAPGSTAPTVSSSDSSVVSVEYDKQLSDGYLYKLTNVGTGTATITTTSADGSSVQFPATGNRSDGTLKSDTPYNFTMKNGTCYQFKFSGAGSTSYSFVCAGDSTLKEVSTSRDSDGSYYFKISAIGTGCVGVYARGGGNSWRMAIVRVV